MSRFQWITSAAGTCAKPHFDRPVGESRSFVALPTLGALVPGWLLVVPRRPVANLSLLTDEENEELRDLVEELRADLSCLQLNVFAFEHGGPLGSAVSCGVDQAHLHLVPLNFDLLKTALAARDIEWLCLKSTAPWCDAKRKEYLAIASPDGSSAVGYPSRTCSQWFRKLIARELGMEAQWDYRQFPALERIDATHALFGRAHG